MKEMKDLVEQSPVIDKICDVISAVGFDESARVFCINGSLRQNKSFIFEFVKDKLNNDDMIAIKFNASQCEYSGMVEDSIIAIIISSLNILEKSENYSDENKIKIKNCKNTLILLKNSNKNGQKLINAAKNELENLKMNIVFIVDELDSCSPEFAMEVIDVTSSLFDNTFSNSCILITTSKNNLKEITEIHPQNEKIAKFVSNAFELNAEIENINSDINRDYILESYLKNFYELTNKERKDFYEFLEKISAGFDKNERNKIINQASLIHQIYIKDRADISVAYFEMFIMFVNDEYSILEKSKLNEESIKLQNNQNLKGESKKLFEEIFGYIETKEQDEEGLLATSIIELADMEDKVKLAFYYLRMSSSKKILYVITTRKLEKGTKPEMRAKINHNCNLATRFFVNRNKI